VTLRTQLWLLAALGVLLAAVGTALLLSSDMQGAPVWALASPFMMLSFIGVGLFAWWRRPHSGFGALMTAVGFVFFLSTPMASDAPALYGLGYLFSALYLGTVVHMLLAFPEGGLEGRRERWLVGSVYGIVLGVNLVLLLLDGPLEGDTHPRNAFVVWHAPGVAKAVLGIAQGLAVVLAAVVIATMVQRWRAASAPERRSLGPVLWTGTGLILGVGLSLGLHLVGAGKTVATVPDLVALACLLALPYVFLVGLGRRRWFRAGAIGSLIQHLSAAKRQGGVREALAEALGDPTLGLLYWLPRDQRYVDLEGRAVELPEADAGRGVTEVRADGRRIAALVHDAALLDDPDLVEAAGAAASLALENERLGAELRARVEELEQSRAGIIAFGLAERRRFERDLHDGAQQRLVALGLQVGMARSKLRQDPAGAEDLLDGAREELRQAQLELRELARGLHPAVLTERGLGAAVDGLVRRATVPVEVRAMPPERLPNAVETVAYFVLAEGLTNVAKYAGAKHASVAVERINGHAVVEVRDDGVGGADPAAGSGLRGLADRVAAVDGRLEIVSPPGAGTVVRARIPCASS
jgi:signal transduction histidine kinase